MAPHPGPSLANSFFSSRFLSTILALLALALSLHGYLACAPAPPLALRRSHARLIAAQPQPPDAPRFPTPAASSSASSFSPSVGAVYVTYRRPKAALHSLAAFRAAYPESDIVVFCDAGCYNYSRAARHFGARYFGEPRRMSTKKHGSIYVRKAEALQHIRAYRQAVNLIRDPYWMHLEDDVFVVRRVPTALPFQINGWALDKRLRNEAERFVRAETRDAGRELVLGGFGGCIYETAYWRAVLNDPRLEDFVARYFDAGVHDVGQDYLFSGILYTHNGTMGPMEGYAERFYEDLVRMLAMGEVTVFHGFKDLYTNDHLTDEERGILGDGFDVPIEGEVEVAAAPFV